MPTTHLLIPYLAQSVANPEIPENEDRDITDAAICGQLSISMTVDTDYTLDDTSLTYPQEWQYAILIVGAVAHTGATNVNVPDGKKMKYVFVNDSGSGQAITIKTESGSGVSVPDGSIYQVFSDGTNVRRIQ